MMHGPQPRLQVEQDIYDVGINADADFVSCFPQLLSESTQYKMPAKTRQPELLFPRASRQRDIFF